MAGEHEPDEAMQLRAALVEKMTLEGSLPTEVLRQAFLRVPRHLFVPGVSFEEAYTDIAIPTRVWEQEGRKVTVSSSTAPTVMATMLAQLRPQPGHRVLEIGAGTGYNAAILAEMVGAENVVSIDLDAEIIAEARANLDTAGYPQVFVDAADGWDGYPARAPYDRILVTVGVHDLAPAWVEQLREGGVLAAPLSFRCVQLSPAFRKEGSLLLSEGITDCGFVDLRGRQPRRTWRRRAGGLTVLHDALDDAGLAVLDEILDGPCERFQAPELAEVGLAFHDFLAFLALSHPLAMGVSDPRLRAHGVHGFGCGIADLERRQLAVGGAGVCFGGTEIGEELRRLAREWLAMGRPGLDRLEMEASPRDASRGEGQWMGALEKAHVWFWWRYRARRG